jgi:hypothetical protein
MENGVNALKAGVPPESPQCVANGPCENRRDRCAGATAWWDKPPSRAGAQRGRTGANGGATPRIQPHLRGRGRSLQRGPSQTTSEPHFRRSSKNSDAGSTLVTNR